MPSIQTDGSTAVSFRDTGHGTPAMLLHCTASCGGQWDALTVELEERHRVIAPDLYGCGESDRWTGAGPLTLSEEADTVSSLIAYCGEPVHLVGHSYGGAVALRVALEHPDWVRSLTLIEPLALYLLRDGDIAERRLFQEVRTFADHITAAVSIGDFDAAMTKYAGYWIGSDAWSTMPIDKRVALIRSAQQVPPQFNSVLSERVTIKAFRRLALPTLVMRGETSPQPTRRIAEMVAWGLRGRLKTIAAAGHMMPISHGPIVNAAVAGHIDRGTPAMATTFAA